MASPLRKYKPKVSQPTLTVIKFTETVDFSDIGIVNAGENLAYGDGVAKVLTDADLEQNFAPTKVMGKPKAKADAAVAGS